METHLILKLKKKIQLSSQNLPLNTYKQFLIKKIVIERTKQLNLAKVVIVKPSLSSFD